jgi:hypothetical protein
VSTSLEKIRAWFRRAGKSVEEVAEGQEPAATPPFGDMDRETSTNAQVEGAVGEPYDT